MHSDMHPEEVKAKLRIAGSSLADLARAHGVTIHVPAAALRRPSPKWEQVIADALGMEPSAIWPRRYADRATRAAQRARMAAEIEAHRKKPRRRGRPPLHQQAQA